MDDEDAEYMQGSEDEVRVSFHWVKVYSPFYSRIMGLTTQMRKVLMMQGGSTSRICTTPPNVCAVRFPHYHGSHLRIIAKKEESPEQALKEFAAIVDQDEPKSDWYAISTYP
jgi:hypothetical protein